VVKQPRIDQKAVFGNGEIMAALRLAHAGSRVLPVPVPTTFPPNLSAMMRTNAPQLPIA